MCDEAEAEPFAPKKENLAPPSVFGLNTAIPGFKGGVKGARTSRPRPSSLTVFGLNRRFAPSRGLRRGLEVRAPGELIAPTAGTLG